MNIGEYIRNRRNELKLSQRDLAIKSNISNAEISRIESGMRKQPSPETLKAIAAVLNSNINDLYEAAGYLENPTDSSFDESKYFYIGDLTDSEIDQLKKYVLFLKSQR